MNSRRILPLFLSTTIFLLFGVLSVAGASPHAEDRASFLPMTLPLSQLHTPAKSAPATNAMGQTIPSFTQVVSGDEHSCGLSTAGEVSCWGNNLEGQVGDGSPRAYRPLVAVVGLEGTVKALAAGARHTCALQDNGALYCWGSNDHHQIDESVRSKWSQPTAITAMTETVQFVAAGGEHTCAFLETGNTYCWGRNDHGQLGAGDTAPHTRPVKVVDLAAGVTALAAGVNHTCALLADQHLSCWGENSQGQLGDNTRTDRDRPSLVNGLPSTVRSMATGSYHTCAALADQTTWCWGDNERGQLGVAPPDDQLQPVMVAQLPTALVTVSLGRYHSCGLDGAGNVYCWGSNNRGLLGDGTIGERPQPVQVVGLRTPITMLAVGEEHSCVLDELGEIHCWGSNRDRQLGEGSMDSRSVPIQVNPQLPVSDIQAIFPGQYHTCQITDNGAAQCWGRNNDGQLGDGTDEPHATPVSVIGLSSGVEALALGTDHTCALAEGGAVRCWGSNQFGQLGNRATGDISTPVDVSGLSSGVTALAAGEYHTCALIGSTEVRCWGLNDSGQLGNDTLVDSAEPVAVIGLGDPITALIAGSWHTCVQFVDGAARCWGGNRFGQLGNGNQVDQSTPVAVMGLPATIAKLAAGREHTCAALTTGAVLCWGRNDVGQLGDGTTTNRLQPVTVQGLPDGVTAIAAGVVHACALNEAGAVACWGGNQHNQVGNGLPNQRLTASYVDGLLDNVATLHAGGYHNCVLLRNEVPRCWGRDSDGQLGTGIRAYSATPLTLSEAEPAAINLNYVAGQPGSVFTLLGSGLPYSSTVTLTVNDTVIPEQIVVNSSGEFILFLDTTELSTGAYRLIVNDDPSLSQTVTLLDSGELRLQEGGGTTISLVEITGTKITTLYLPLLYR